MIEDSLYTLITTDGTLSTLLGTRVYPIKMPDNPLLPALVYTSVGSMHAIVTSGRAGWSESNYHIDVWDRTFASIQALLDALRLRLQGYFGTVSGVKLNVV